MNTDAERADLMHWIAERRKRTLRFGAFDCCTMCADYLIDLHGKDDLMHGLRGTYSDRAQALAVLSSHDGMRTMVEDRLGPMQPMVHCEAGAIVFGDFGEGDALGICCGHNIAAVGVRGLVFMPLTRGQGCWPL